MSRLVARILLSMLMFPLAVMLYALAAAIGEAGFRGVGYPSGDLAMFLFAGGVTWAGVAAYWCLLWRAGVRWTPVRVGGTVAAAAGALALGVVIAVIVGAAFMSGREVGTFVAFLGGVLAILLWLFATVFLWRETTAERAARVAASGSSAVACPTCGCNLTGLGEARCPECGNRFTLDELLAAQPAQATAADDLK